MESDGHLTIMKFTTNWRVGLVTVESRYEIEALPGGTMFREAARAALEKPPYWFDDGFLRQAMLVRAKYLP
jgi:hypothetical protein